MFCSWCKWRVADSDGLCTSCLEEVVERQHTAMARAALDKTQVLDEIAKEYAEVFGRVDPIWWFERCGNDQ
jgi:hypothetical protein